MDEPRFFWGGANDGSSRSLNSVRLVCASGLLVGNLSGRGWAMFRRPEQDRMIPLCIDQQLAIDAEQRSPANRNPVLTRRSYLIKGDDTDWRIAVALEARCHCAESSRPRFSALPGPLCCRFGFPVY